MAEKNPHWDKGCVHVYTGNGKGKTTASFGLALRSLGAGFKVFVGQFVKGMKYSEIEAFKAFGEQIVIRQLGRDCFIHRAPEQEDIDLAREGLAMMREVVMSGEYKLVIFDEANIATYFKLFPVEDLVEIIENKPEDVELVFTGRYAEEKLLEKADLITEMKEIRHYYANGIQARKGIEN